LKSRVNIKSKYKLVICYWKDIVSEAEWSDVEDAKKLEPVSCVTVGWLLRQDTKTTTLTSEFNFTKTKLVDECGNTTTIPTSNIIGMKTLKVQI
tara:strand:+ start:1744 stop:2025 length:282 start_codon:yes stop_codon:yes gene_type:complete